MHAKVYLQVFTALLQLAAATKENKGQRCGRHFNDTKCPPSTCCSGAGYCGTTVDFCSVPGNCQRNFGVCDHVKFPNGVSTIDTPRFDMHDLTNVIDRCSKPRTLALSFDDGPSNYTENILDVLAEFGARATFFVSGVINGRGSIDEKWASTLRRMVVEGHQIGSHTWSHAILDDVSSRERKYEMYKNERAIANVIGKMPTFMRAPQIRCADACQEDMIDLGYHIVN